MSGAQIAIQHGLLLVVCEESGQHRWTMANDATAPEALDALLCAVIEDGAIPVKILCDRTARHWIAVAAMRDPTLIGPRNSYKSIPIEIADGPFG